MKTYEAMFLVDAGNPDFEAAAAPVRDVLDRIGAEVLALKPWDERKLAYDIAGRSRALYILTYFRAAPARVTPLQHEVELNERILRAMVFSADHVTDEQIRAETPATASRARRAAEPAAAPEGAPGATQAPPSDQPAPAAPAQDKGPEPAPGA